ncbi:MAG: protein kinase [Polyangiaceae bacterium]|nr:protein kinase [Polyangiaceae bacterium]
MEPRNCVEVGQVLGDKYRIVRLIGRGGMGTVYEARHDLLGRRFAIKVVHEELNTNTEAMARFRREALAAGALESENIAAVVDFGQTPEGVSYIVMEFLEGQDLASFLEHAGRLSVTRAVSLAMQACRGLHAAHAKNIVHRDLKPENLFLTRRGDGTDLLKVLDFGIAKLCDVKNEAATVTKTGAAIGTCFYMSPEQARGARDVDTRTDIYAVGVILYELLSGRRPHEGRSLNEVFYSILSREPPRLNTLRDGLPEGLCELVHRTMAKEIEERPTSVDALLYDLAPFAESRSSFTPRELGNTALVSDAVGSQVGGVSRWPTPRANLQAGNGRRPPLGSVVAAVGALILAAGVAVWLWAWSVDSGGGGAIPGPSVVSSVVARGGTVTMAPIGNPSVDARTLSADGGGQLPASSGSPSQAPERVVSDASIAAEDAPSRTIPLSRPTNSARVVQSASARTATTAGPATPPPTSSAPPIASVPRESLYEP